jgi:hypothetical protein
MIKLITRTFATVALTFAVVCLWSVAAHAATYEETCTRRPMVQGMVGETVVVCELRRVSTTTVAATPSRKASASKPGARTGRSPSAVRAESARKPAPVVSVAVLELEPLVVTARPATALRVAALDVDGTCGGLPAACCDWRTGSRAVCGISTLGDAQ